MSLFTNRGAYMALTNEQIMLLEQLTYLADHIANDVGVDVGYEGDSIAEYLAEFDEATLDKMGNMDNPGGDTISGKQWEAIIRAIKDDPELMRLKVTDINNDVHVMCFEDPDNPDSAIVAFRGTDGQREWEDNAVGLYSADTPCQEEALRYIESLPYDDITVTGHSKGGNKAQYVTILSDKVKRCVSMDGQGFSQEFLDKYYAEIMSKGHLIVNYYVDGDYVNILMFPMPGSDQICVASEDDVVHAYYHNPSSFYHYELDENGNWVLKINGDGSALFPGERSALTAYLHDFTCFLLNVMPAEDREGFAVYFGHILGLALEKDAHFVGEDGVEYTHDDLLKYIASDPDNLALFMAYFLKYVETYNLSTDEIVALLEFIGIDDMLEENKEEIALFVLANPKFSAILAGGGALTVAALADLIKDLADEVRDGKTDPLIEVRLALIEGLFGLFGINLPVHQLWRKTEKEYQQIPEFDPDTARNNGKCPAVIVRDFSTGMYNELIGILDTINANMGSSINGWSAYSGEDWYNSIGISNFIRGLSAYINNSIDINNLCKTRITNVFTEADRIDILNGSEIYGINQELSTLKTTIRSLTNNLG